MLVGKSHTIDIDGPVHYVDYGGTGEPMVLVHGIGGSHANWEGVAHKLAAGHRVLALDLVGFGFTGLHGRQASVTANRGLLDEFISALDLGPVVLVGNSMGGLIAMMEADDEPEKVASLILVNPALPATSPKAVNWPIIQRLMLPLLPVVGPLGVRRYIEATTPESQVEETFEWITADPDSIDPELLESTIQMARHRRSVPWTAQAFAQASRSIAKAILNGPKFRKMVHRIAAPTLLIHGEQDRVVDPHSARWLANERPDWTFRMLGHVGHVPQIEMPDKFVELVSEWHETLADA